MSKPTGSRRHSGPSGWDILAANLRALIRLTFIISTTVAAVWLVSTDAERQRILDFFGLADILGPAGAPIPEPPAEVPAPPAGVAPSPGPRVAAAREAASQLGVPDLIAHAEIDQPCLARPVLNPTRKTQRDIYRWTDANGKTVFSDRNPAGSAGRVVGRTAEGGIGMFSTDYRYIGAPPDARFQMALAANIDGVFRFIAEDLALEGVEPLHVRLTIVTGTQAFADYRDAQTANLATTSGFYRFDTNEAVIRWRGLEATMAVARHEITHLALGNWLGRTPLWLNEGLAELIEQMHFQQSYAVAPAPGWRMRRVDRMRRTGQLPPMRRFMAMDRSDWNRIGNEIAYNYAWSLVRFLLQTPDRRSLVSEYLNEMARNRCRPVGQRGMLDRIYPGGLAALDADWQDWIGKGEALPVTY